MSKGLPAHIVVPSVLAASVALMLAAALTRQRDGPSSGERGVREGDDLVLRLNREANRLSSLGRHEEALAILGRVLEDHPGSAPTHYNRGRIHHLIGDDEAALGEYDRAIELRPDYAKALTNRALILARAGETERAIADLSRSIELAPDRTAAWYQRGRLRLAIGLYDEARADFNRVLELDPADEKARASRAEADQPAVPGRSVLAKPPGSVISALSAGGRISSPPQETTP